ncbi:conserved hypothetical protein [Gluconacetobacter diazotrophicus PA1 5]|uniref:Lipoprotein n=1 Tax=Gluconacetobacter diazotrophicus (strain ATCC 49037 / DSM 5601 / CCUG 37298 / CIP 103539 / LMG 7603 / PAl5) TaxID=272568 RepID=A9HFS9_GLUDA|nr:conserved hypothetical protein [Gluconacetobacter diazotrophicus PA1 5]
MPLLLLLACPLLPLAACDDTPPQTAFAPMHYDYLPVLHLNVGTITTVDNGQPGSVPGDISGRAPTPPDQALLRMAADRLMAAGSAGSAVFTIDRASILHMPGGTLEGQMDVHLDVTAANGQRSAYAEAHVHRSFSPGASDDDGNADSPAHLYTLTSQMMKDMNIELEFQIRHHLADWLVDTAGTSAAGAIQQQTLGLPGTTPDMTATPAAATVPAGPAPDSTAPAVAPAPAPAPAAAPAASPDATPAAPAPAPAVSAPPATPPASSGPDAIFPTGAPGGDAASPDPAAPRTLSPQPGYLTLPPGTATAAPATTPATGTPASPADNSNGY